MDYLRALEIIHHELSPDNYVEIGCRLGKSISLSRCQSIAIDPDFEIKVEVKAPTRFYKVTSDEFFQQYNVKELLSNPIDLAFIDGMHKAEYVLRDFINIEKNGHSGTVIIIDDVLPEKLEWTTRERLTQAWTGDVYQMIAILRQYRPDLQVQVLDVEMKGMALITKINPASTKLSENYKIIEKAILADEYKIDSAASIRNAIKPLAITELQTLLFDIKKDRSPSTNQRSSLNKSIQSTAPELLYLNLLKSSLLNEIYLDNDLRLLYLKWCMEEVRVFNYAVYHDIRHHLPDEYRNLHESRQVGQFYDRKIENAGFSHSMMGRLRMDNLHQCLTTIQQENIAGDFIECGVWRGGGTIFMAGFARVNGWVDRKIFVADSFEGLPKPSLEQDENLDLSKEIYPELAIPMETVRDNFKIYDLLSEQVVFLKGWFKDTLGDSRINQLALLRLDGDLYESTMDALRQLYDKVVIGGFIIVDDFGIKNCEEAVNDFFSQRNESMPKIHKVDWTGVYWRKS